MLSSQEVREAIEEPVEAIVDAVKYTLDKTPPELAADVMERGIVLTGGGALLRGLDAATRPRDGHADRDGRSAAAERRAWIGSVSSRSSTFSTSSSSPVAVCDVAARRN